MSDNLLLYLQIAIQDSDLEEIETDTLQLYRELGDVGVESVERVVSGQLPNGAKGIDPILLGTLAVMVTPTLLTKFLDFLHAWSMRKEGRTLKLKIQNADGSHIEVEVPTNLSKVETQQWINMLGESLNKPSKKGKKS